MKHVIGQNYSVFQGFFKGISASYAHPVNNPYIKKYLVTCYKINSTENLKSKPLKTGQAIALGAGAVVIYSLFRKRAALGTLNFFPDKIKGFRWDGMTPILMIGLGIQNTSNQSFTIHSIAGSIYCNSYYIGNLSTFTPTVIPRNSEGFIVLNARLQLIGIVNDIIEAAENGNFSQEIVMKAKANVDNLQIPINLKFSVGG